jgi:phage nucleotide-binding protein
MEIKQTNKVTATKINCLIYSPSGHGKTTLASTLDGKTLVLSLESGLLSLRNFNIDYVEITGSNGIERINSLKKLLPEIVASDYDNIYIDSLSEISSAFVDVAKKDFPDVRQTMPMYGLYNELMTKFIKYTRDMNKNIFYTALEKVDKDELNRRFMLPDIIGSIAHKCPAYFDFVFNLRVFEKDNIKVRKLLTRAQDGYLCKDRSGELSEYEDANLGLIIKKVFNESDKNKAT